MVWIDIACCGCCVLVMQRMDVVVMQCNVIFIFELLFGLLLCCLAVLSVLSISHFGDT